MASTLVKCFVVFAFLALASAQDNKCTVVTAGDLTGTPVQLPRVTLPPPQQTWDISISQPCAVLGVKLKVCDEDAPPVPTVEILNLQQAWITRRVYSLLYDATVDTTVYCALLSTPVRRSMMNSNNNHVWV